MNINETIAEVLRLDEEATQGPWDHHHRWGNIFDESSDPPFSCRRGETRREDDGAAIVGANNVEVIYEGTFEPYDQTAGVLGAVPADATLIAYYRTAAPALAREVKRLQAECIDLHSALDLSCEREARAYLRGQEAMRERAAALVDRAADAACECDGTLCGPDDVAPHDEDCRRFDLDDLADAIRALEVER